MTLKFLYSILIVILLFKNDIENVDGSNILFFTGYTSYSHRATLQTLAEGLVKRGHQITFLSPIPPANLYPNITDFCPSALVEKYKEIASGSSTASLLARLNDPTFDVLTANYGIDLWKFSGGICDSIINSPDMPDWVQKSSFDLVIIDHPVKECAYALVHKFKAKSIALGALSPMASDVDTFGWPSEDAYLPNWKADPSGPLSWFLPSHFIDSIDSVLWYLSYTNIHLPAIEQSFKKSKVFGYDEMPPLIDLIQATNLYLVNIHFSVEYPRSFPPNVISIGGMYAWEKPTESLPKSIRDFIEGDDNLGFIYVSYGSIIKISELPEEKQKAFVDTFRRLKNYKFLLKWEGSNVPKGLSSNVFTMKWFPQKSVLAHPKCRGFITQGGVVSFQQSIASAVPLIIMPTWADQPYNARLSTQLGIGIHLEMAHLTADSLENAINQLVHNPIYSQNSRDLAIKFWDRPMSPLDTALYWTEYVLRHPSTSHLKPMGMNLYWWQRRQLDAWISLIVLLITITIVLVLIVKSVFKLIKCVIFGSDKPTSKKFKIN